MSTVYVLTGVQADGVARQGCVPTGRVLTQHQRLALDTTSRLCAEGTGRIMVEDGGAVSTPVLVGTRKIHSRSFTVPTDHEFILVGRAELGNNTRATLEGTADIILSDDFRSRSRITLAGRG